MAFTLTPQVSDVERGALTDEQSSAIDAVCAKLTPTQAIELGDHIRALRSIQWQARAALTADAVGEVEHNQVEGFYFQPYIDWRKIGVGTKLYAGPLRPCLHVRLNVDTCEDCGAKFTFV